MSQLDSGIKTLYEKLVWGAHCTCWARARNLHLFCIFQGCRPNQWTDTTQTLWADAHQRGAGAIVVSGDEGHKQHVPEGYSFLNVGSSEFVNFCSSDSRLGTLAQLDRGIKTPYDKLVRGAHCTCWARASNLHLFFIFQGCRPTSGRI